MADAEHAELARRYILLILDAARTRERERSEDPSTYTAEELIQRQLDKMGLPMLLSHVRAELYFLRDEGLVKYHDTKIGRDHYFTWRITSDGIKVLEGHTRINGIASE